MAAASATETANLNDAKAQVVPDTPPTGTQACKMRKPLRLGVFFDGTGNNKYVDEGTGHETNVVRLLNVYLDKSDDKLDRDKLYLIGVGAGGPPTVKKTQPMKGGTVSRTVPDPSARWSDMQSDEGTGLMGAAFGKGMKDRCNIAYKWVKERVQEHTEDSEKLVDTYGFSRGAAGARTFTNLISQALPKEQHTRNASVRFLGIFDTVASTGMPGDGYFHAVGLNLGLTNGKDFKNCRHCTARDEVRGNFPLSLLGTNDTEYAGVHSDVGGSYAKGNESDEKKSNWLAGPPVWDTYTASKTAGVEFTGPPKMPDVYRAKGSKDVSGQVLPADEGAVEAFKAECDKYDGTAGDNVSPEDTEWRNRFVHDSTQRSYAPITGFFKGNSPNMVDDTSKKPTGYDPDTGQPIYPQIAKRSILTEKRYTLGAMPPDYSWD